MAARRRTGSFSPNTSLRLRSSKVDMLLDIVFSVSNRRPRATRPWTNFKTFRLYSGNWAGAPFIRAANEWENANDVPPQTESYTYVHPHIAQIKTARCMGYGAPIGRTIACEDRGDCL